MDLINVSKTMDIPKRRLYDVVNVMEGAGMLERGQKCNTFRLTPAALPAAPFTQEHVQHLKEQEADLDSWIAHLEKLNARDEDSAYVTSRTLGPLHQTTQDSILLGIASSRGTTVQTTPPPQEENYDAGNDHHVLTLCPPSIKSELPQVYVLESADSMRELSLLPNPPLMERCCSDFSYNALSSNGGLLRQSSIGSNGDALFRQSSIGSFSQVLDTSPSSTAHHHSLAAATHSSSSLGAAGVMTAEAISAMPMTTLQYHESFGLLDKSEPPPPVTIDPQVFPCTAPDYVPPANTQDENSKPFQYPWLKGTPLSDAKFRPKRSTKGLLCDSDDEDDEPEPLPQHSSTLWSSSTWLNNSSNSSLPAIGMKEASSLLPNPSRRSSSSLYLDNADEPEHVAAAKLMMKISEETAPVPTALHACTSLVLWND